MTNQQLKKLRISLGHSQNTMADALGVSSRQYQYYESGHTPVPESIDMRVLIKRMSDRLEWWNYDNHDLITEADKYILKHRVKV